MARFARSIWNEMHGLTAQEIETIKRFESEPNGTLFVAAAEILRKRGYIDEAIVIMEDGIKSYPNYFSARASLGRDYYLKGMMSEAVAQIALVVQKSPDNLMAQRLRLKLALIFNDRDEVVLRLGILKQLFPDDDFTKIVRDFMAIDDWSGARALIFSELYRMGIRYNSDTESQSTDAAFARLQAAAEKPAADGPVAWEIPAEITGNAKFSESPSTPPVPELPVSPEEQEATLPTALRSGPTLAFVRGEDERYLVLKGFRRVQSVGLFSRGLFETEKHLTLEGRTLAEIYVNQGLYAKACAIYERIIRENPSSENDTNRLNELREICRAQAAQQKSSENSSPLSDKVARMTPEQEKKLRFLEDLLTKLDGSQKSSATAKD